MKQILFLLLCILSFNISSAQTESIQEVFEGEISAIKFNNLDKKTERFSSGVGYNGNAKLQIFAKGNKVLVKDKSLLYSILYDPNNNVVTYYCEGLGKGISIDYSEYWNVFATFSKNQRTVLGFPLPTFSIYELSVTSQKLEAFGYQSEFIKLRAENQHAGTDMEFEVIKAFNISHALNLALIHGSEIDGFPIRYRWTQDLRAGILGQMKSYQGFEIIEFNKTIPNDSIFEIPANLTIEKKGTGSLHGFLKQIGKYLKKNDLFPDQRGEEVTYELDESEWDY